MAKQETTNSAKAMPRLIKPKAKYSFVNGHEISMDIAVRDSLLKNIVIWKRSNKLNTYNMNLLGQFDAFDHAHYDYRDYKKAIKVISRQKLSLCESHVIPGAVKIPNGSKAQPKNLTPTTIDADNFNIYRVIAHSKNVAMGVIIIAGLLCTLRTVVC